MSGELSTERANGLPLMPRRGMTDAAHLADETLTLEEAALCLKVSESTSRDRVRPATALHRIQQLFVLCLVILGLQIAVGIAPVIAHKVGEEAADQDEDDVEGMDHFDGQMWTRNRIAHSTENTPAQVRLRTASTASAMPSSPVLPCLEK